VALTLLVLSPAAARAQPSPPVTATPLPPVQTPGEPAPSTTLPPLQVPSAPYAPQTPPGESEVPVAPPAAWVTRGAVDLQMLNKIDATSTELTVKVGQSATYGSLSIAVKACEVRPPGDPPDAAAYLVIADSRPDEPGFTGWMLHEEPWVAMLQSPVYDVRVLGCRP
jgi:hypothetical protein